MTATLLVTLLVGAGLAAAISSAAGFGGALVLLPLLIHAVGPTRAVALLTLAQLIGNASRLLLGWREVNWRAATLFLTTAVPAACVGALLNGCIDPRPLRLGIGAFLLLLVVARRSGWLDHPWPNSTLGAGGALTGLMSGLAGTAGPLGAAVFLTLRLSQVAYVATEAVTALGMHTIKLAVYGRTLSLNRTDWLLGLGMGVAMFAGTWAGRRLITGIKPAHFALLVDACLVSGALSLLAS